MSYYDGYNMQPGRIYSRVEGCGCEAAADSLQRYKAISVTDKMYRHETCHIYSSCLEDPSIVLYYKQHAVNA